MEGNCVECLLHSVGMLVVIIEWRRRGEEDKAETGKQKRASGVVVQTTAKEATLCRRKERGAR